MTEEQTEGPFVVTLAQKLSGTTYEIVQRVIVTPERQAEMRRLVLLEHARGGRFGRKALMEIIMAGLVGPQEVAEDAAPG